MRNRNIFQHVVPSIATIKEIAGDDALEVNEEYQDVYMCENVACIRTFAICG
jgi:hypothetical protein